MKWIKNDKGFTLVELIVVVIILAILAAAIIPQLTGSTSDAKEATLDTNLGGMRSAIELYSIEHSGVYPGFIKTDITGGGAPAAHATVEEAFLKQMTKYSDINGNTSDVKGAVFKLGPYLKKGIPSNPFPNAATTTTALAKLVDVDIVETQLGKAPFAADAEAVGWKFRAQTGEFVANNTVYEAR